MKVLSSITARMLLDRGMTWLVGFRIASEWQVRQGLFELVETPD
jgi:hypothetical protein